MYVGWDWASQRHDVTVIDDTGQLVDRWTLAHTEAGIHQAMPDWPATADPMTFRWPSRPPAGSWSTDSWPPGTPWSRPPQQLQRRPTPLGSVHGQVRPR